MDIIIDLEFKDYLGALGDESRQALEESLKLEGCRDALVIWHQDDGTVILLDGHNRHELCAKHDIPYLTINCPETVVDRESALAWIVENQRARRNITPERMAYITFKAYGAIKEERGGDRKSEGQKSKVQNEPLISGKDAATRVAEKYGMSRSKVKRNIKFGEQVDAIAAAHGPEAKEDILEGRKAVSDFMPEPEPAPLVSVPEPKSPSPVPTKADDLDIDHMRKMSDSDCVRYMAEHAVILPGQDCGAVAAPIPLPASISENFADPEVAKRGGDALLFALLETERHVAAAGAALQRRQPPPDVRSIIQKRIADLVAALQSLSIRLEQE